MVILVLAAGALGTGCAALGRHPTGARQARMERSPQWQRGGFVNPQPLHSDLGGALVHSFVDDAVTSPEQPLPVQPIDPAILRTAPASGLRVTWLGHSTFYVELDGRRVLTDPVWSSRASPVGFVGPQRWYPPLIALKDLPVPDAVVISHDHFDHLDHGTIVQMREWATTFIVPLGVGAHLEAWGIAPERIQELDWWEETRLGDLRVVATPARHASGRTGVTRDRTLWCGFAMVGPAHRVYFSGDTGLFPALRDIGARLGPFDLTMIESGAYSRFWPDWHIGPEQAVLAHQLVRGRLMLPAHWGLFTLSRHAWTEPIERVLAAAERAGVRVVAPRPGQSVEPAQPLAVERWWPDLRRKTAEQDPIVSSGTEGLAPDPAPVQEPRAAPR